MDLLKWKYDEKCDNDEERHTCTYYVTIFIDITTCAYMTKN